MINEFLDVTYHLGTHKLMVSLLYGAGRFRGVKVLRGESAATNTSIKY